MSPIGAAPDSISVGEGENPTFYAKYNNMLYIWSSGQCPDGKNNVDGICHDHSFPIFLVMGVTAGTVVLIVASVVFGLKIFKRQKKTESLLESQTKD